MWGGKFDIWGGMAAIQRTSAAYWTHVQLADTEGCRQERSDGRHASMWAQALQQLMVVPSHGTTGAAWRPPRISVTDSWSAVPEGSLSKLELDGWVSMGGRLGGGNLFLSNTAPPEELGPIAAEALGVRAGDTGWGVRDLLRSPGAPTCQADRCEASQVASFCRSQEVYGGFMTKT